MSTNFDLVNESTVEKALLEYERLLNQNGSRRYHLNGLDDWLMELVEAKPLQTKKIVGPFTADQMLIWFKKHVKVVLDV